PLVIAGFQPNLSEKDYRLHIAPAGRLTRGSAHTIGAARHGGTAGGPKRADRAKFDPPFGVSFCLSGRCGFWCPPAPINMLQRGRNCTAFVFARPPDSI